ncbi:hypothetical protein D3C72_1396810 [compost metagenome]
MAQLVLDEAAVGDGLVDPRDEVLAHIGLHVADLVGRERGEGGKPAHHPARLRGPGKPKGQSVAVLGFPFIHLAEGAMDAVRGARGRGGKRGEALSQALGGRDALDDLAAREVELGLGRHVARHPLGVVEVVVVVRCAARHRDRIGEGLAGPAGATDALLVVEALGRHVGHHHELQ